MIPACKKLRKNRIREILMLFALLMVAYNSDLPAEKNKDGTITFEEIWDKAGSNSPALKAASYEYKSAEIASNRSGRHWYPRIYAGDRIFRTNDPAQVFMMDLGQRSIRQSDFNPDTLNRPGHETFNTGTLGIDLPVYEGGAKYQSAEAMKRMSEAKKYQQELARVQEYANLARAYGTILISNGRQKNLNDLQESLGKILEKYELGSKANPVGYSGLLSINTLINRIEVQKTSNEARILSMEKYIEEDTLVSFNGRRPDNLSILDFTQRYLVPEGSIPASGSSYMTMSLDKIAAGQEHLARAEAARFLPRFGIFTEANLYSGSSSTETSYNAGFYVQMNIFSATDYGAFKQAKLTSSAARARADESRIRRNSDVAGLTAAGNASLRNIGLITDSMKTMNELLTTSLKLFNNGAINALQLTEVFSRKADLIDGFSKAEDELLNARAGLLFYTDSGIKFIGTYDYGKDK